MQQGPREPKKEAMRPEPGDSDIDLRQPFEAPKILEILASELPGNIEQADSMMLIMALASEERPRNDFLFSRMDGFEIKGQRLQATSTDILSGIVAAGVDRRNGAAGTYGPLHMLYDSLTAQLRKDHRDPDVVLSRHLEWRKLLHDPAGRYELDTEERAKFNYLENQIGRWAISEFKKRVRPLFFAAHEAGRLVDLPADTFDAEILARFSRLRLFQAMDRFAHNLAFDDLHLERLFMDWIKSQGRKINQRRIEQSAGNDK